MNYKEHIESRVAELLQVTEEMKLFSDTIDEVSSLIVETFNSGKKVLFCGNGGSAAEAQHIATEYVVSLRHQFRRKSLPAIALTTDTSLLTAGANDFGYESIFERQIESLGEEGDVLFAISTSGNSGNIIKAIEQARKNGMKVIGLTGRTGGKMKEMCDFLFNIPSDETMRIQECHLFIEHTIVELVEEKMFDVNS